MARTIPIGKYLRKLTHVTLADLWNIVLDPSLLSRRLTAPPSISDTDALLLLFPHLNQESVQAFRREFITNHRFFDEFYRRTVDRRLRRPDLAGWKEFLYVLVRIARPRMIIETGVFDGHSSAVILQALTDNRVGNLISIDLPATETIVGSTHRLRETTLPANCLPGWAIPDYLRDRHHLILGDSREVLPKVLAEHSPIDIFLHDSLHTHDHMRFEYTTAWPYLCEGGFLLSDDIYWTPAFHQFCRRQRRAYVDVGGFGAVKK